ncbi:hypothetical protein RT97_25125 [Variovorax paradoxus]|uniref:Transmembrane protein n=1 Tax=Variovorax paradoxus TaxID=34073 RepID=A0A0D0M0E1_VARPD|nr:hypothetical protein [Variovorax paradoxus]KIQ24244.1 hypothetical protein RT97_25125 [Variovorax paradoxus]
MVLDFCISFGLAAPVVLSFVLYQVVHRAVAQGRMGPLAASLAYGLCVAALPLAVWWGVHALAEFYIVGEGRSFLKSVLQIGLAFLMYAYLCISWGLSFVAACLAAWRFSGCAKRLKQEAAA